MDGCAIVLPQMSPAQRRPLTPAKSDWAGDRRRDSSQSTAASDGSSDSESLAEATRSFSSYDVSWLLATLNKDQQASLEQSQFHHECQRIFRLMDKDASGFLDEWELQDVIALLILEPEKTVCSPAGRHHVRLSVESVLSAFDKDSDQQLSAEEFPDFVCFCYAWKNQQERMLLIDTANKTTRPSSSPAASGRPTPELFHSARSMASIPARGASKEALPPRATMAAVESAGLLQPSGQSSFLAMPGCPMSSPPKKAMTKSASNPCVRHSASSRRSCKSRPSSPASSRRSCKSRPSSPQKSASATTNSSRNVMPCFGLSSSTSQPPSESTASQNASASSSRLQSLEPLPSSAGSSKVTSRSSSKASGSSRHPSKSKIAKAQGLSQPECIKPLHLEDLATRHMQALKALLKELVPSHRHLPDLVSVLLHKVIAPEGNQVFSEDSVKHVCELVLKEPSAEFIDQAAPSQSLTLLQDLGHFPGGNLNDEDQLLMNQAIEVMALLSLRWFAMKNLIGAPEMSDYQRRRWLPPAFSNLVGQVIWRHRTAKSLQAHTIVVENLRWITFIPGCEPGCEEDVMDGCNAVFRIFSGSDTARMKLRQFRKVVEVIASNPELRVRVRRCDPVRACYGDAVSNTTNGLTRKQFKLMLMKTADLMKVHPIVLFQEMASQAASLEAAQKVKEETKAVVPFVCRPATS